MAHGGALALNMRGTMDQEDQRALLAGRPLFQWHARHEDLYVGQQNVTTSGQLHRFTLPRLDAYEIVVLEE